jgi:hypothetical protein
MAQSTLYSTDKANATHDLRDKATDKFDQMAGQVEGAVKSVAERGREVGEDVQAVAGNIKS